MIKILHKDFSKKIIFYSFIVLLLVPVFIESTYIRHLFIMAFIYGVIASNWNLSLGYTGILNFGHLAFFGIGVYTAGIFSKQLGVSPFLTIPLGGLFACVGAIIISVPILRLKGIYVILVSFAFSQICLQFVLALEPITGGSGGLPLLPSIKIGDYNLARDGKFSYYYISLILLTISTVFLYIIVNSKLGLRLIALRDNEELATSRGISVSYYRLICLVLSAFFTGVIGGFFAHYARVASYDIFGFGPISLALSMLLIGGTGSVYGPIIGSIFLMFLSESLQDLGAFRFLIIGSVIIIVMLFFPGGLNGLIDRFKKNR